MQDAVAEGRDLALWPSPGWSAKPMSLVQATRSVAARTISSQAALASKRVTGQVAQSGGLGLPDAVLDPGVLAVTQFQPGELPGTTPGRCR